MTNQTLQNSARTGVDAISFKQVLGGFELTTDADIYCYPERYRDKERGGKFWDKVMDLLPSI